MQEQEQQGLAAEAQPQPEEESSTPPGRERGECVIVSLALFSGGEECHIPLFVAAVANTERLTQLTEEAARLGDRVLGESDGTEEVICVIETLKIPFVASGITLEEECRALVGKTLPRTSWEKLEGLLARFGEEARTSLDVFRQTLPRKRK